MDEKDSLRLSWPTLFMVTALSFVLFNVIVKLLEGSYSPLLFRIAIIAAILGALSWLGSMIPGGKKTGQPS
jgi:hypothetical protein